jgi:hypothetical protein
MKKFGVIVIITLIFGILYTVMPMIETQSNDHSLRSLQAETVANAEIIVGPGVCAHTSYKICFYEPDGWFCMGDLYYI